MLLPIHITELFLHIIMPIRIFIQEINPSMFNNIIERRFNFIFNIKQPNHNAITIQYNLWSDYYWLFIIQVTKLK